MDPVSPFNPSPHLNILDTKAATFKHPLPEAPLNIFQSSSGAKNLEERRWEGRAADIWDGMKHPATATTTTLITTKFGNKPNELFYSGAADGLEEEEEPEEPDEVEE